MDAYYDLGSYSRPVTTSSPEAQVWCDRGLRWYYGFNLEESVRCYRMAAELDSRCAMAHWGYRVRVRRVLQQEMGRLHRGRVAGDAGDDPPGDRGRARVHGPRDAGGAGAHPGA